MAYDLKALARRAQEKQKENKKFFRQLKKKPPKRLDYIMQGLHQEAFEQIDCLACANCCKIAGPLFTANDIRRISKYLKMKQQQFIEAYLYVDEDQDYVLQQLPCAFLGADNYCSIYSVRPKACAEYPHTDRKKFHQIASLTMKNIAICPAAELVVGQLKEKIGR
ncbi:MAG: YkgJ family cysteine cluster protein [Flavobacteriaceae bacterium]|nr:YkgJ family cysteine cluster protein [Flavobacteriaceae bacterium]